MKQPKFGPIFLACGLLIIFSIPFFLYVNRYVDKVTSVDDLASVYDNRKFDGLIIGKKAVAGKNNFYMFDSSNLSSTATNFYYHPSNIFKGQDGLFTTFCFGEPSITSIHHVLRIVTLGDGIRNQKILYFAEPVNFIAKSSRANRVTKDISALQAYYFVYHSSINKNLKARIAKSLIESKQFYKDPVITCLLVNISKKHSSQIVHYLFDPLGHVILAVLEQFDRINTYQLMNEKHPPLYKNLLHTPINWDGLMRRAEKEGENACRTNNFSIIDEKYNANFKPNLRFLKNSSINNQYLSDRQIQDFQLLLDVFKEYNLKPIIIIEPVNGPLSDYTGVSKKVRYQFYTQIKQMVQNAGFEYVDYSSHEYEKYFLFDSKHVGWKGWVYIDQAMERFYKNN
jgi:D-alanine transfer protein